MKKATEKPKISGELVKKYRVNKYMTIINK